jgi:hypothetical protein
MLADEAATPYELIESYATLAVIRCHRCPKNSNRRFCQKTKVDKLVDDQAVFKQRPLDRWNLM